MVHPVAEANDHSPFGTLTPDEFYTRHSVTHD
ncbi:monoglyceride lipase-like, partial [Trifolium medium]|nr:monoglyceride lipase-like [Trifolium medium]